MWEYMGNKAETESVNGLNRFYFVDKTARIDKVEGEDG